jgi:small subunit ribosomal protein S16
MLKIKLTRVGKRDQALYRIVVNEARDKRDGKYTDILGQYNPGTNPATVTVDKEKYASWIEKGAQPTQTVKKLIEKLK